MDKVILAEKPESLRRCVKRLEDKRIPCAAELCDYNDRQDILSLNLTRAVQFCVDMAAHLPLATE